MENETAYLLSSASSGCYVRCVKTMYGFKIEEGFVKDGEDTVEDTTRLTCAAAVILHDFFHQFPDFLSSKNLSGKP